LKVVSSHGASGVTYWIWNETLCDASAPLISKDLKTLSRRSKKKLTTEREKNTATINDERGAAPLTQIRSASCKNPKFGGLRRVSVRCQKGSKCSASRARPRRNWLLRISVSATKKPQMTKRYRTP